MSAEQDADRAAFFSRADFGEEAIYAAAAGGAGVLNGLFDDPHLSVVFDQAETSDARPSFLCRAADLPAGAAAGAAGDTLTVRGATYDVVDLRPDGQGMTLITLGQSP